MTEHAEYLQILNKTGTPHLSVRGYVDFKITYFHDKYIRIRIFFEKMLEALDDGTKILYICAVASVFFACKQMRSI